MSDHITKCLIKGSIVDPTVNVVEVWLNDEPDWQVLFTYYPNELHFYENEFIGLTVEDALKLRLERDLEYLRS